ncbi:sulfite reductase (NADPH) flavoprotein alpha-component [Cnuella takakiae]|uniref:assimilatory sulfite reductase (NADPH) n=1 Tax=Cnuella takakiae TaxID=1302690 RepID=A0A1M5G4S3_9BACT|nr:flavodoxin domain-containing protein [Cnuella takakiae]OLY92324.1 sulfite reductase [Cnuella takakiae]SHF98461.1 sulfite reductase (NADPH) flavoprotein alpha-component [Cnuella takakiae]
MLSSPKLKIVEELIASSTREELAWISGYLAGIAAQNGTAPAAAPAAAAAKVGKITIAYGTETGNSKKLASEFAAKAKKSGINAKLVSLDQYRLNDLAKEEYFVTVISTQGEGEPPAAAKKFYDHIHNNGFKLEKLKYGVLALGDTSYPLFCKAGEDVDAQLNKLGGQRLVDLAKCDTDYEAEADAWFSQLLTSLSTGGDAPATVAAPAKKATAKKTYTGTILTNINLNDRGSSKETHHLEIGAEDVDYQPGDALGLIPRNSSLLVADILAIAGVDGAKKYAYKGEEVSVADLLTGRLNLVHLPERVVAKYAAIVGQSIPATRMGLLDLLKIYPLKDAAQFEEVVAVLEPIAPRLYSISSSPEAHSGEVHLTVARDKFCINGEDKYGLCSDFLTQQPEGAEFEFYIHKNNAFRLPADDKDVIMIGPGTGIAPFRSFLAQRDATGAGGRNWLFFGDQHFVTDFLYQTELLNWVDTGVLTKLNVAFSRDQKEKIYVQHRMLQQGKELYEWMEGGASVYVCGAKEPMSVDVEATLVQVVQQHGGKSKEEAEAYIATLKENDRYQKDVY